MAEPLSISSSEPGYAMPRTAGVRGAAPPGPARGQAEGNSQHSSAWWSPQRFPWAFLLALALIASVEAWLHVSGWPKRIPWSLGQDEYHAVVAELDKHGSAEVAIVGSSRTRESMHMPVLRKEIRKIVGRHVGIANYAQSGARTYDFAAIVRRLLRDKHPPRIIVVGISERDLGDDRSKFDQAPLFWNLADWKRECQRRGFTAVVDDLPTVLRSYIGRAFWTLRYRDLVRVRLRQLILGERDEPTQLVGDLTRWQRTSPDRSLLTRPVSMAVVRKHARTLARGTYPNPELAAALRELAAECKAANVRLIFYEVPVPGILSAQISPRIYERFTREVKRVAAQTGARFLKKGDLRVTYSEADFREPSHMNAAGARRLSLALAKRVLGPELAGLSPRPLPTSRPAASPVKRKPKSKAK